MIVEATDAVPLIAAVTGAVSEWTCATTSGRSAKTREKDTRRAIRALFVALADREPTEEEMDRMTMRCGLV